MCGVRAVEKVTPDTLRIEEATPASVASLRFQRSRGLRTVDGLTQVVVKLADDLEGKGDVQVSISLRGSASNKGVVTIKSGTSP